MDSPWVLVQLLDPDNRDPLHAEDDDPIDDKHRVDMKTNINILKSIIENKQIVTAENKQIMTVENKRVCNSEDNKLLTRVMNCIHKQYTKVMMINKVKDKRVYKSGDDKHE